MLLLASALQAVRRCQAMQRLGLGIFSATRHSSSGEIPLVTPKPQLEPETPLLRSIRNRIMIKGGPLSIAEYMQEVLTNPAAGFYMHRDVFGTQGDFVTSPEISQMFGEMLGIWCVMTWMQLGQPPRLNLVELGPGRGTLMADLLRGTAGFSEFSKALAVHLVEVSPALREQQWRALRMGGGTAQEEQQQEQRSQPAGSGGNSSGQAGEGNEGPSSSSSSQGTMSQQQQEQAGSPNSSASSSGGSRSTAPTAGPSGTTHWNGAEVTWHSLLATVPSDAPTIYLAHEFLDALPVHQFVKDPARGWLEVMVDTADEGEAAPHHLRFVTSPGPTPASALLVPRRLRSLSKEEADKTQALEVGAQAMVAVEQLAQRIAAHSGAALLIDYGQNSPYSNSLTAIRKHEGVHVLSQPGTADLSAWVDFAAMRVAAEDAVGLAAAAAATDDSSGSSSSSGEPIAHTKEAGVEPSSSSSGSVTDGSSSSSSNRGSGGVDVYGPVTQSHLLLSLGIQTRVQMLAQAATSQEQVDALESSYKRLVLPGPEGMGSSYQALAIVSRGLPAPVGFEAVTEET